MFLYMDLVYLATYVQEHYRIPYASFIWLQDMGHLVLISSRGKHTLESHEKFHPLTGSESVSSDSIRNIFDVYYSNNIFTNKFQALAI